jgi:hypothetical protein
MMAAAFSAGVLGSATPSSRMARREGNGGCDDDVGD